MYQKIVRLAYHVRQCCPVLFAALILLFRYDRHIGEDIMNNESLNNSERIQKYISSCGIMSRRKAEEEILAGKITVNGEPAYLGMKITPGVDIVEYEGIAIDGGECASFCIMLNKPVGYVTTMHDEKGRKCVADLVKDVGYRVYPCGRLDLNSEGLLLLTNDGELANMLMHPKHHIPKVYLVKVSKTVTKEQLEALNSSMVIDGYKIKPAKTELLKVDKNGMSLLKMTLHEGRNRQIRKMCDAVELKVMSLKRVAIGNIELGNLKSGMWKKLTKTQVQYLKSHSA